MSKEDLQSGEYLACPMVEGKFDWDKSSILVHQKEFHPNSLLGAFEKAAYIVAGKIDDAHKDLWALKDKTFHTIGVIDYNRDKVWVFKIYGYVIRSYGEVL